MPTNKGSEREVHLEVKKTEKGVNIVTEPPAKLGIELQSTGQERVATLQYLSESDLGRTQCLVEVKNTASHYSNFYLLFIIP